LVITNVYVVQIVVEKDFHMYSQLFYGQSP